MKDINLDGHWENDARSLQLTFNEDNYECYVKTKDGKELRGSGTVTRSSVIKENIEQLHFSDFPKDLYLWGLYDKDQIIMKDEFRNLVIMKKK